MKVQTPISASRLSRGYSRQRSRGFTLLELLIVCALLALAAGLVGPFLAGNDQKKFSSNLRQISAHLKNARRRAIVTGSEQHVRLATTAEEPFTDGDTPPPPPDWLNADMRLHYAATIDDPLEEAPELDVTFFPLGSSTGGVLQLSDQNDREAFIYVFPLTGKMLAASSIRDLEDQLREVMP